MRDCVVFITHFLTAEVHTLFERLQKEVPSDLDVKLLLIVSGQSGQEIDLPKHPIVCISQGDLLKLDLFPKCNSDHWVLAGNLDLAFLEFVRRHPVYDRYWFVEYDVHWEGNWSVFFERFRNSDADVLAASIHKLHDAPQKLMQLDYPKLEVPSCLDWHSTDLVKAFLPICRLSRDAIETLRLAYERGLGGHYELTIPSAAAHANLTIEDFGGDGVYVRAENRNRFYFATAKTYSHSPGTFVFRPSPKVLRRTNTLWHPIKPVQTPLWHPMRGGGNWAKTTLEAFKPILWQLAIHAWFATRWRPLPSDPEK